VYVGLRNVIRQAYTYVEKMLENERTAGFSFGIGLAHLFYSISHTRKFEGILSPSRTPHLALFNSPSVKWTCFWGEMLHARQSITIL
jgi:hypothetical protein